MHNLDDIRLRRSVRTYKQREISPYDLERITECLDGIKVKKGPFSQEVDFSLLDLKQGDYVGTYGIIKNPPMYIGGTCHNTDKSLMDLGYLFEGLILDLTHLNLGTCWMAGTFKRERLRGKLEIKDDKILAAISPVGYTDDRRTLEVIMHKLVKADNRLKMSEILYFENLNKGISHCGIEDLNQAFDMVRLGPSAANKQPWRMVLTREKDRVHFYLKADKKYEKALKFNVQAIDLGISMYHFEFTLKSLGYGGRWLEDDPHLYTGNDTYMYGATYEIGTREEEA